MTWSTQLPMHGHKHICRKILPQQQNILALPFCVCSLSASDFHFAREYPKDGYFLVATELPEALLIQFFTIYLKLTKTYEVSRRYNILQSPNLSSQLPNQSNIFILPIKI